MKILYISENINHHMIPLANALDSELGLDNFRYAVLKPIEESRIRMGFNPDDQNHKWCIKVYENASNYQDYEKWFQEADVVLFSSRDLFAKIEERLNNNKLTFYFSERWWKPSIGMWRMVHPKYLKLILLLRKLSKSQSFHYLAQGGYAGTDIQKLTKFKKRIWKFGYFTDVSSIKSNSEILEKKITILWCGRMLKWKNVDVLIKAFANVAKYNTNCHLKLIGDGEQKEYLIKLAKKILPIDSYSFLPSQPVGKIRKEMNDADIYVLPSSGYEGWGAVLNEAMAEKCSVIATEESGAGKAMIKDGYNGFLFKSGDWKSLSTKLEIMINDEIIRNKIQVEGTNDIKTNWSPEIAAKRLISISKSILEKKEIHIYENGPFSAF